MIGRIKLKRAVKRAAGWAAAASIPFSRSFSRDWSSPHACILVYHRVAEVGFVDPYLDDWNVPPPAFERQIAALKEVAEVIPLPDLPKRLAGARPGDKPLVCLTFDDGYASVLRHALPVLQRYQAPATIFLVTKFIGFPAPLPFDRWSRKNCRRVPRNAWRALDWPDLDACLASGLITIGAHSHQHLDGRACSHAQLVDEAGRSHDVLFDHFGESHAQVYAYPYGCTRLGEVPGAYVKAVQAAGFRLAVSTDLGLADTQSDPYRLPRVETHALDTPAVMRAKAFGALVPYRLTDRLRQAVRNG